MILSQRLLVLTLAFGLSASFSSHAAALELLTAGGFELDASEVPSWDLQESRNGNPGEVVNAASLQGFANSSFDIDPGTGLWLRAFEGNPTDGTIDAILSQTVTATPGEMYSFSGEAAFEQNYAGGVATLDPLSTSGAVVSPTQSLFQIEFLDAGGAVIGSPIQGDVANDTFNGFGYAAITPVTGMAPAGTAEVRVSAIGTQMIQNIDPGQTAFYDNFSLTASSAPAVELLANGDLNAEPASALDFFEITESPEGSDTISLAGFANNPDTGGTLGAWIRAFVEGDSTIAQTVDATVGGMYEFTASSRWEEFYSGGQAETGTETLLELAFLDAGGEVIGDAVVLDVRTEQMNDNTWRSHSVTGVAPEGAIEVRVAGMSVGTVNTEGAQSAFWDDFSLMLITDLLQGDANGDGNVDLLDLDILGSNFGLMGGGTVATGDFNGDGNVDLLDLDILGSNFGASSGAVSVPEPMGLALAAFAAMAIATRRRS